MRNKFKLNSLAFAIGAAAAVPALVMPGGAAADIAATHIYHNHMPNFWPYYDTSTYATTKVGGDIRYMYDGQAYQLKLSPPAGYKYLLADGSPMPHDDFAAYYQVDAKQNAYSSWPAATAKANSSAHPLSQTQVTMSGAVINDVQSFAELGLLGYKTGWAADWQSTVGTLKTTNGFNALEPIHFTGHHSMGPLVGPRYFLKDLIFQNVTLQRDYFLGSKFKSSKGFFPTELGFSERLIPTLVKLGIEWSVVGNNHFSRALTDYPYVTSNPAADTMVSPPNRAELQNTFAAGGWERVGMAHEQQTIVNKFPFCAIPHWVQYIDPATGKADKIAAIPVDQNGSWLEGWEGLATVDTEITRTGYEKDAGGRKMYFVIAHDGDNSSGRAGSYDTWMNSGNEYSSAGEVGMGVQEYLKAYPIPEDDIQHIQDGSWVDTRDSSSDPDWYHWHIPMGVWAGQIADFNAALGTSFEIPTNFEGTPMGHAVSMEYGYHYLERNFALLQAAENYATTAEQIWLDAHPNYWSPTTDAEKQVTYSGNQLNPYMFSYPVKGDESNDYKGGANPAELGWYFLIASIDSGFGYYDENKDDNVKPTLGFNQSLFFTEPYVQKNLAKDKTGPSMWWVQRYPTNPGSANSGKAEGWVNMYADNTFAIYTYAYDVSGISDVKVYVRPHTGKSMLPTDVAPRVYDPKSLSGVANNDPTQVGDWVEYPTKMRDLEPDMNGVAWQDNDVSKNYKVLPGLKIGNTYYAYISDFRDQLVDYYMEATDNLGNVTRSEIGHTYVGAGRYNKTGDGYVEAVDGEVEGTHMFFTDGAVVLTDTVNVYAKTGDESVTSVYAEYKDKGAAEWNSKSMSKVENSDYFQTSLTYTRDATCADVRVHNDGGPYYNGENGTCLAKGTWVIAADGKVTEGAPSDIRIPVTFYFKPPTEQAEVCVHFRGTPQTGDAGWTEVPGKNMTAVKDGWWSYSVPEGFGPETKGLEFLFNDCKKDDATWFKTSGGGNFTSNTVTDVWVDGTTQGEGVPDALGGTNKAPVAKLVADKTAITAGESVTLDASGSTDSDGKIVSYKWSTGATTVKITVTPAETTKYTVTVTDDDGATASASVTVTVNAAHVPPKAVITASATEIAAGEEVTLSAENSEGEGLTYLWSTGETTPTITVKPQATTTYTLTVTDSEGVKSETVQIVITVKGVDNQAPEIHLVTSADTADRTVEAGTEVTLDASGSADPDGDEITFKWSNGKTDPKITETLNETTAFTVTVTDSKGASATETAEITVIPAGQNAKPVAKITGSSQAYAGEAVKFDGSGSTDDKGVRTYAWFVDDVSAGANSTLTYTFDQPGDYTVKLVVTDEEGETGTATLAVTVIARDQPGPVGPQPLQFTVSADEYAYTGDEVAFTAVTDGAPEGAVYKWKVDGVAVASQGSDGVLRYTFGDAGTHTVEVTVEYTLEGQALTSSASVSIKVNDRAAAEGSLEFGSGNEATGSDTVPFVVSDADAGKAPLQLEQNKHLVLAATNAAGTVEVSVDKVGSGGVLQACAISGGVVDCNPAEGSVDHVIEPSPVSLEFPETGEYRVNIKYRSAAGGEISGYVPLNVTQASQGEPGGGDDSGGGGGGAMDPLSLILMAAAGFFLRRRERGLK